jgi:hypothetical protein
MVMTDKEKKLYDMIKKYGINHMRNITDFSVIELIQRSKYPISLNIAYEIIFELYSKGLLPKEYNEFELKIENLNKMIIWSYEGRYNDYIEKMETFATPFWNDEQTIPVENDYYSLTDTETGEEINENSLFQNDIDVKTNSFKDIEELLTWYKNFYLVKVYEYLKRSLILVREDFSI